MQQSMPNIARLSLEEKKGTENAGGSARNNIKPGKSAETDGDMVFSTANTSL